MEASALRGHFHGAGAPVSAARLGYREFVTVTVVVAEQAARAARSLRRNRDIAGCGTGLAHQTQRSSQIRWRAAG